MKEELKPCLDCGKKAKFEYFEDGFGKSKAHAFCSNWRCVAHTKPFDTEQQAIEAWNRRITNVK